MPVFAAQTWWCKGLGRIARQLAAWMVLPHCVGALAMGGQTMVTRKADSLFPYCEGEKWGYIDRDGVIRIRPTFSWADDFASGLARVETPTGKAYVDPGGAVVFAVAEDAELEVFSNGRGWFTRQNKWGCVDRTGTVIIEPRFDAVQGFSDDRAAVNVGLRYDDNGRRIADGTWGVIDKNGRMLLQPAMKSISVFSDGLAWARPDFDSWICIDTAMKSVFTMNAPVHARGQWFSYALEFSDGVAVVGVDGAFGDSCGFIDAQGKWLILPVLENAKSFAEGMAAYREKRSKKWGYITRNGQVAISARFEEAGNFADRRAPVKVQEHWNYIDQGGSRIITVIEPAGDGVTKADRKQMNDAEEFRDGLARVHVDGQYEVIHGDGVWFGGSWYYIDQKGKVIRRYMTDSPVP